MSEFEREETPHVEGMLSALEYGSAEDVKLLLGNAVADAIGTVRAGIKVPIKAANEAQKKLYDKLLSEGKDFDFIDKALMDIASDKGRDGAKKSWTTPFNPPFMTVHDRDFRYPQDVATFRKEYGDENGRIFEFPIWFPDPKIGESPSFSAFIDRHLHHGYRGFHKQQLKFASFPDPNNPKVFLCRYKKNVEDKVWHTRPCPYEDAKSCPDYVHSEVEVDKGYKRLCNFGGTIRGNVPAMRGIGAINIHSASWHTFITSIGNLREVKAALGRVTGLYKGQPFLRVTKYMDIVGKGIEKKKQFILCVEPSVDMMELYEAGHREKTAGPSARFHETAATLFGSPTPQPKPESRPTPPVARPLSEVLTPEESYTATGEDPAPSVDYGKHIKYMLALYEKMGLEERDLKAFCVVQLGKSIDTITPDEIRPEAETAKRAFNDGGDILESYRELVTGIRVEYEAANAAEMGVQDDFYLDSQIPF